MPAQDLESLPVAASQMSATSSSGIKLPDDACPVRTESSGIDGVLVPAKDFDLASRGGAPDLSLTP